jgi:predicted transposase YdaD
MASTLYQSIIKEGETRGEARGEARQTAETIIRALAHRLGALDPAISDRIRAVSDIETLTAWYEEALLAVDAEGGRRLAEKIQKAPLPSKVA